MKYLSADYQDEIVHQKNAGLVMFGVFVFGVIAVIYNPEGRGWIVIATAIYATVAHALSGGKQRVKKGEYIVLNERGFDFCILRTGYQVSIPYKEVECVKSPILPPNSIKLVLSGNREMTMHNFSNSSDLLSELRSRAGI